MSVLEDKILEQQETIKGMQQNEDSLIKIMKEYEDYKLRVDKAIQEIDYLISNCDISDYQGKKLKNILKGDFK